MERHKSSSTTMSPLMTYQEAADYLRISLATIDRMVRAGRSKTGACISFGEPATGQRTVTNPKRYTGISRG